MSEIDWNEVVKKCHCCKFKLTRKELLFRNFDLIRHGVEDDLENCPNCGEPLEDLDRLREEIAGIRKQVEEKTGFDFGVED